MTQANRLRSQRSDAYGQTTTGPERAGDWSAGSSGMRADERESIPSVVYAYYFSRRLKGYLGHWLS